MVCESMIKQMEKRLGRNLTKEEKKKIEERMHHSETSENKIEEGLVCA